MNGFAFLAGIGLVIFGVRFLRKGLDRLFGGRLLVWISRAVTTPWRAFTGGLCAGIVAPSSTGLTLLVSQMLSSARLDSGLTLAVLLGANVGLTVAVQLLAFRLQDYAGLLIISGVIAFQFLKRELFRGLGQCVLALGFVFLAIHLIGEGARRFSDSADFLEFLHLLQGHPWLVLLAVSIITVLLQSSTATIGLGLGLAASGLLEAVIMIPWVIGTTLGIAVTSLIAGWNTLEGRRLGTAHFLTKLAFALPFMLYFDGARAIFDLWPASLNRQTAIFYTEFNLAVGLLAMPVLARIDQFVRFLIPDPGKNELTPKESFLDENVLGSPSFALARATRETLRMADHVRLMLENFWMAFSTQDTQLARHLQAEDDTVDRINLGLKNYLSCIGEGITPAGARWQFALLGFSNELESAGDLIDKHLCDLLIKQNIEGVYLHADDESFLQEAYEKLLRRFELASGLLTMKDENSIAEFLTGKEIFNDWSRKAQRIHYERLPLASRSDIISSAFFLDYLNAFRRINSHLISLGYALKQEDV